MPDAQQADLFNFRYPLKHLTKSLNTQRNTKIVAFGSSSTAGKSPVVPFPAYLELMLRGEFGIEKTREFGKRMINVINRGVGGEEASTELPRMQSDVIDEAPSLVIWQVGTNAVFRNTEPDFAVREGFRRHCGGAGSPVQNSDRCHPDGLAIHDRGGDIRKEAALRGDGEAHIRAS